MKKNLVFALLFSFCVIHLNGQNTNSIDWLKSNDFGKRKQVIELLDHQRGRIVQDLISILNGNYSADVKDSAATVLGDYRAKEAVDALSRGIVLDARMRIIKGLLTEEEAHRFSTALIKIGNPSIPAVIRNLAESDDAKVRELSLRVLIRIDGDKDIVQLRLQKALAAETISTKQARLQAALKALAETVLKN